MPRVIPFVECVARPDKGEKRFFLKDHLIRVKHFAENWLESGDKVLRFLIGLACVCHDMIKAHIDWQKYIVHPDIKKGPTHAPAGAFFFSYLGYQWLQRHAFWEQYRIAWLWLIRDIADHHGRLKSLNETHWIARVDWEKMDLNGIVSFLREIYPEFNEIVISEECLDDWLYEVDGLIDEVLDELDQSFENPDVRVLMKELQKWRDLTTSLISADRLDVEPIDASWLTPEKLEKGDETLEKYCASKSNHPLSGDRLKAQHTILKQFINRPNERFYTLELPTGYGKTITAMKIALWLGKQQNYKKIIYVAPYLSILEQTSHVIKEAMDIGVLEHHSLALLDTGEQTSTIDEQRVPVKHLAMEAWAHGVICTSFQQWSKAIFPGRAQDVLRRVFLQDSVVIIDEPQIFNPDIWNLFLIGLEALAEQKNLKIIFLSATMPPFKYGLSKEPVRLTIHADGQKDRYVVQIKEKMDEEQLAEFLSTNEAEKQAAILNTIKDAYLVYQKLAQKDHKNVFLLHGMMIPLHKKVMISKVQKLLESKNKLPIKVISTQIIEAGVDVSFQHVARAASILPSVVQAAGRVNRHFELEKGMLSIVPFYRHGKQNTRNSIYDKNLQLITDQLLGEKEYWAESEMVPLVQRYYDEMFKLNTYEAANQAIIAAYEGRWPELGSFQPFGSDYFKLPIFVPWEIPEGYEEYLPKIFLTLQRKFDIKDPISLYERYADANYLNRYSFEERKQFMMLFHHYVLNIPVQVALKLVSKEEYLASKKIPKLYDTSYHSILGLVKHFDELDNFI